MRNGTGEPMSERPNTGIIRAALCAVVLLLTGCPASPPVGEQSQNSSPDERPNFLVILTDDVSPDLYGAYGLPGAATTPNVDRLAAEGVMFKTAYATAMCGPTRAEIMTGRYAMLSRNSRFLASSSQISLW